MSAGGAAWLTQARRAYRRTLPDKYARLEQRLAALLAAPADRVAFEALLHVVHGLHGSAGSYGFEELGRLAGEWEVQLLALRRAGGELAPDALEPMWAWLTALRRAQGPPETPPCPASARPPETGAPRDTSDE